MRDWNKSIVDWDDLRLNDYFKWVKETYGDDEFLKGFIHVNGYRAVMDIKQEEPERQHNWGWTDARGIYGSTV